MYIKKKNVELLEYIAEHTGWNASIESASDLADNLAEIVRCLHNELLWSLTLTLLEMNI